jgi:hypothetical protein
MDKIISIIHAIVIIMLTGSIYILTKPEHDTNIAFRILWIITMILITIIATASIIKIHIQYKTAQIHERYSIYLTRIKTNYEKSKKI